MGFVNILVWTLVLVSWGSYGSDRFADQGIAQAKKLGFKITYEEGKPIQIVWPDGREASSFKRDLKRTLVKVPIEIVENQCVPGGPKASCFYNMDIKIDAMEMRWTRHPKESRVGEVILRPGYANDPPRALWTSPLSYLAPASTAGLKEDELSCDRWDWLPGADEKSPPEKLKMSALEGYKTGKNSQTGVVVNRGYSGFTDLIWSRTPESSLRLTKVGRVFAANNWFTTPFFGFLLTFTIENPVSKNSQEKFCQVTIRPDASTLISEWSSSMSVESKPSLYALGSDDLFYSLQLSIGYSEEIFNLVEMKLKDGKPAFTIRDLR